MQPLGNPRIGLIRIDVTDNILHDGLGGVQLRGSLSRSAQRVRPTCHRFAVRLDQQSTREHDANCEN